MATIKRVTLDHVWIFATVALIALRVFLTPVSPHDFWWHMATGRLIVQTGHIPTMDSFSFTRINEPFFNQSWLAQILMYSLYAVGGVPFLVLFQALLLVFSYGLLLRLCIKRSGALRLCAGLLLITTMPLSFDNWNIRPQSYAFPLFTAFFFILSIWRETPYRNTTSQTHPLLRYHLWMLPLLMILWVNIHGSFILGGVLIALTFIGEWGRRLIENRRGSIAWATRPVGEPKDVLLRELQPQQRSLWPLLFWGAVTAVALLINPRGFEVLQYVRNLIHTSAITDLVTEWAPPTIREMGGVIFFLFLIVSIIILTYSRRLPDPVDMVLAGVFLWLALGAVRNIVWFGMVMTPLLSMQATAWQSHYQDWRSKEIDAGRIGFTQLAPARFQGIPAFNSILIGIIAFPLFLSLPWFKPALGLPPALGNLLTIETPVTAVKYMQTDQQRPKRLFHEMSYGSYLIWEMPEQKVFIDPRIELYPFEQWIDYGNLSAGKNVPDLLARYQIDGLLLDNTLQSKLLTVIQSDPTWEIRFADEQCTYLVKRIK